MQHYRHEPTASIPDRPVAARLDAGDQALRRTHSPSTLSTSRSMRGETLALLGPNGAGKTTAIRMLLGLARPTSGSATIFGRDPRERAARERVGAMLQVSSVPATLTVAEHLELFASYYPRPLPLADVIELACLRSNRQAPLRRAFRRRTAAPVLRACDLRRCRRAVSRRTERRPRCRNARTAVGRRAGTRRTRQERAVDDALSARSRCPRRSHRSAIGGRRARRGHAGPTQSARDRRQRAKRRRSNAPTSR